VAKLPIREWCDALGTTQAALGRRAGLAPAVISDYVRGHRNPTLQTIEALARAIDRQAWEFLRGPLPGEGLPSEAEARQQNIDWFRRLPPSRKARAAESSRRFARRAMEFARSRGLARARG
jgi:transcriptional regulator with XRE-family HTH domain